MNQDADTVEDLEQRARAGDQQALARLFDHYGSRLRRMVQLRLDRRVQGRIDVSDVLQEAYLDAVQRVPEYAAQPGVPFYLWLRGLTGQRLLILHRCHLGAQMRDAGREVSLHQGVLPRASSVSLAAQLLGHLTSPSEAAIRAEAQRKLQEALEAMEPLDREVLTLRHLEELSNSETAAVLGLRKAAASNRYMRALRRLKEILSATPGLLGG